MKIIIVTTEKEGLKETGFGGVPACLAIKKALKRRFADIRISVCARENDMEVVIKNHPDLIILAAKYIQNKKGDRTWFSEYFDENKINYTGSRRDSLGVGTNKILAKEAIQKAGLITAPFTIVEKSKVPMEKDIGITFPIFLKPLDAANGNGIDDHSLVFDYNEFLKQSAQLFQKFGPEIVAEKYLGGREFTVSVIEDVEKHCFIVSPIEIIAPASKNGARILGEKVKLCNVEVLKRVDDEVLRQSLIKIALQSFRALEARDFARIDIRQDEDNVSNFLEVSLAPGMTEGSGYFPRAFEIDKGIAYIEVVGLMIKNAMNRVQKDKMSAN